MFEAPFWLVSPPLETCYLLGAGASYGCNPALADDDRPPTGVSFMDNRRAEYLLKEERYSALSELWHGSRGRLFRPKDVEDVLSAAADSMDGYGGASNWRDPEGRRTRISLQDALGEFYYFAFELLRDFGAVDQGEFDNYRALAESWPSDPFSVLTLNYDVLLELAIERSGLSWVQSPGIDPRAIPISKVHGSVNWFNPCAGGVSFGGAPFSAQLFRNVARLAYSNKIWTRPLRVISPAEVPRVTIQTLVRNGSDYDHPALLPPFGSHKDYEQVRVFQEVWRRASDHLSSAKRIVIIGSRLRALDWKLREVLVRSVQPGTKFVVVGGGNESQKALRACLP